MWERTLIDCFLITPRHIPLTRNQIQDPSLYRQHSNHWATMTSEIYIFYLPQMARFNSGQLNIFWVLDLFSVNTGQNELSTTGGLNIPRSPHYIWGSTLASMNKGSTLKDSSCILAFLLFPRNIWIVALKASSHCQGLSELKDSSGESPSLIDFFHLRTGFSVGGTGPKPGE